MHCSSVQALPNLRNQSDRDTFGAKRPAATSCSVGAVAGLVVGVASRWRASLWRRAVGATGASHRAHALARHSRSRSAL